MTGSTRKRERRSAWERRIGNKKQGEKVTKVTEPGGPKTRELACTPATANKKEEKGWARSLVRRGSGGEGG